MSAASCDSLTWASLWGRLHTEHRNYLCFQVITRTWAAVAYVSLAAQLGIRIHDFFVRKMCKAPAHRTLFGGDDSIHLHVTSVTMVPSH
jgi:hypothetical protein